MKNAEERYCHYLKNQLQEIEEHLEYSIQEATEYADEYFEYNRGSEYELLIDQANTEYKNAVMQLYEAAVKRCVSEENLEKVFGDYSFI